MLLRPFHAGGDAALGLAAAQVAVRQVGLPFLEATMGAIPFWFDLRLSPRTVLYACAARLKPEASNG
jgi:putative ABC transport system permease protein